MSVDSLIEKSAGIVNHHYVNINKSTNLNPFTASTKVYEFRAITEMKFVRVHNDKNAGGGRYFTFFDEIDSMSPKEIQQYLVLPELPTHVQEVIVPPGAIMHMGSVRGQPMFGIAEDGGVQIALPTYTEGVVFQNSIPLL